MFKGFRGILGLLLAALVSGLMTTDALAQQGFIWRVEYFNNPYLIQPNVAAETIRGGNFSVNWGTASPAPSVPADNFSARFSTAGFFAAGTYRFTMRADDGVHLIIDNLNKVIDTYDAPQPGQTLTADVFLSAGDHHLQVDYRESSGEAYVSLSWQYLGAQPPPPPPAGGIWTAQYYSNINLAGAPVATISEASPTHNWGSGQPLPNLGADNFSVRWTSTQFFSDGLYDFVLRADDGVRLYVDGILLIDQWHTSSGQTYIGTIRLGQGNHTITVEYFEQGGLAFIDYSVRYNNFGQIAPTPAPTGPLAQVVTGRLNVRDAPNPFTGNVLTKISLNDVYPVTGRLPDNSWYQLRVNNITGWVNARYIRVTNVQNVPIVDAAPPLPQPSGYMLSPIANLSLRAGPDTSFRRMTVIPANTGVVIVGRNLSLSWWQVSYEGQTGWVSGRYVRLPANIDFNRIPVTANT